MNRKKSEWIEWIMDNKFATAITIMLLLFCIEPIIKFVLPIAVAGGIGMILYRVWKNR